MQGLEDKPMYCDSDKCLSNIDGMTKVIIPENIKPVNISIPINYDKDLPIYCHFCWSELKQHIELEIKEHDNVFDGTCPLCKREYYNFIKSLWYKRLELKGCYE